MTIKTGDAGNIPNAEVDRTRSARNTSSANTSSSSSSKGSTVDSIALTSAKDIVQRALNAGSEARLNRIQELRNQVENNQYSVDAVAVSHALIESHLAGD